LQDKFDNIAIALAGLAQAISLVKELAQTGKTNEEAFRVSIHSIFQTQPKNTLEVFGDVNAVKLGLQNLVHILSPKTKNDGLMVRYMLSLMRLQKKISRSSKLLDTMSQRVKQAQKQVDYFSLTHPTVISNLADIYIHAIGPFKVKLLIAGNQRALAAQNTIEKIRALLLAAIRASVLWRQIGGSRLQLLFFHKKIKASAEKLLRNLA
jgi:high frequency lysogenization protein